MSLINVRKNVKTNNEFCEESKIKINLLKT